MPHPRLNRFLFVVFCGLLAPLSAFAQMENVKTVEGVRGEKMTLTAQPRSVAEGLSVRAIGVKTPMDSTRWALSLIGAAPEDEISIRYGEEMLPIESVSRPEGGVGPTRVYISQETFLTMAETETVRLVVGDVTAALPEQLRTEMQYIFDQVV